MRHRAVAAGRGGISRPAVVLALSTLLAGAAVLLVAGVGGETRRGPIAVPNPAVAAPVESTSPTGVRRIANSEPPEILHLDPLDPDQPTHVVFFQGRSTQPHAENGVLSIDGAGGVLRIDTRLRARRQQLRVDGRDIAGAAAAPEGGLWLVTGDGEIVLVNDQGVLVNSTPGPFAYSMIASDRERRAWVARSAEQFTFQPEFGSTPLLARLDAEGELETFVGNGVIPPDFLLSYLASTGHIAIGDSTLFYAPFIRDEVIALSMTGDTLWVASRGLPQSSEEPRLEVVDGDAAIDYAPVNLALAIGPDDRLYVLSVPGFTTDSSRVDVFDPSTGHLVRTATIDDPLPTIGVDGDGRTYLLDPFGILTGVPSRERAVFKPFNLETLTGGQMTSGDLRGKVVLVNFWASWCAPCRIEMPALDSLRTSIPDEEFRFITMNEDVNPAHARSFIDEYGFDFPVLLGRGDLKQAYHYTGLPFTVLLDREGKVITRWIGYAGDTQIQAIRAVILAELERGVGAAAEHAKGAHAGH